MPPEMSKFKIGNSVRKLKDAAARSAITVIQNALSSITGALETIIAKLNGIAEGAEVNVIDTVKINGTALPVTNKAVDIVNATQTAPGAMSSADKIKLDGVASGAEANAIDTVKVNGSALPITGKAVDVPVPSYVDATQQTHGLMSAADKVKLDGVASGANANVIEEVRVNGTALPVSGKAVDVPVPSYSDASSLAHGLMSAADKAKLDGIAAGATAVIVDPSLSGTSENPVQNKAVKSALDAKADDASVVKTVNGVAPVQGDVTLPVDSTPAPGSGNPVSSDAVASALQSIQTSLDSIDLKLSVLIDKDDADDGQWIAHASYSTTYQFHCSRRGKLVCMFIDFYKSSTATGSDFVQIGTLPTGYYPARSYYMQIPIQTKSDNVTIRIDTNGALYLYGNHTTAGRVRCTMTYCLRAADF